MSSAVHEAVRSGFVARAFSPMDGVGNRVVSLGTVGLFNVEAAMKKRAKRPPL